MTNPHRMSAKELERRWKETQLSENALEIARQVLVHKMTYEEVASQFKVTKQYVGKIVRRIVENKD